MFIRSSAILSISMCVAAILSATTYNCMTFSVPGASSTNVSGINNAGAIVGTYTAGGVNHGFIANTSSSSFQAIDYPGSMNTRLFAINNSGVVTGEYNAGINGQTPGWFTRDAGGNFSPITVPAGDTLSAAYGINDNGAISVWVTNSMGGSVFGVLNPDGTLTTVPNGLNGDCCITGPASVNIARQMLEVDAGFGDSWLVDTSGNAAQIRFGGAASDVFGLNNAGFLVGYNIGFADEGPFIGFSRDPSGVYSELLCPGSNPFRNSGPRWQAVNDNGVVAGDTTIATPIPGEPQVGLSVTSLTFPPTPVGQTTAPQSLTITNTGNARLDIAGIRITSSDFGGGFGASGCAATAPVSLDSGASCTVMVASKPTAQGTHTATLLIDDSAPGGPQSVALSVTGTNPGPSCKVSSGSPGPPAQLTFTIQDTNTGLKSIVVADETNATASIPTFASGTTGPVTVTATQSDPSQSSRVDFQATNVAGGATTCGATFGGPSQWTFLGGNVTSKIAVVENFDGRLQVFVRGSDNSLGTIAQATPDNGWANWENLGGVLGGNPVAVVNPDGRLQVFALSASNAIMTKTQIAPNGSWSAWQVLTGTVISDPAVAVDGNGDLGMVAVGSDHTLWVNSETSPGGSWSGWSSLGGGILNNPALIANQDGRLQAFVIGMDNGVWTNAQMSPGGSWSGWTSLGGNFSGDPVVIMNQDGRIQVFGTGTDDGLWTAAQTTPGGGFSGFSSLGGIISSNPAVAVNSDGRLEAFVRGLNNNQLWHIAQATPGGGWAAWAMLGGVLEAPVSAATNQDGRVAAFVEGTDASALWTIAQSIPGLWN